MPRASPGDSSTPRHISKVPKNVAGVPSRTFKRDDHSRHAPANREAILSDKENKCIDDFLRKRGLIADYRQVGTNIQRANQRAKKAAKKQ